MIGPPLCYELAGKKINVKVTEVAGMLTAAFLCGEKGGPIRPFAIAPWVGKEEISDKYPPLLRYLQGDFDCWFGGNATKVDNVQHLPHGDPANLRWDEKNGGVYANGKIRSLYIKTKTIPGGVEKIVALRKDHNIIYTQTLNKVNAKLPVGHHATIRVPIGKNPQYDVATSPFIYGGTYPGEFTEGGGRPRLAIAKEFNSLDELPLRDGSTVRLNDYYATEDHEDLVMVSYSPTTNFAWSAMTNLQEKYIFFTLKDPRVLASTVFWLSHFGRTEEPWAKDGKPRHGYVMGMEDVSALFCLGIAESLGKVSEYDKLLQRMKQLEIKTFLEFNQNNPTPINYIMGVAPIPNDFEGVKSIEQEKDNLVTIVDKAGKDSFKVPVNWSWLHEGNLDKLLG